MKHSLKITVWLVVVFFLAQVVGLLIINQYVDHDLTAESGKVRFQELPFDIERPPIEEQTSFLYIVIAIIIATILVLILIRFKKVKWWRLWFFISVVACMTFAFAKTLGQWGALLVSAGLGYWKVFRPNVIVHNLTELFIYGGLAVIFVPVMNVFAAIAMLFVISLYDMYAVWKSKHMVKLAEFQKSSKVFAGLHIPYSLKGSVGSLKTGGHAKHTKKVKVKSAVLGGGDIGFPLIFAGVVMKGIMLQFPVFLGFLRVLIISLCASIALLILLIKAKKDRYYPAMPFITAGCLIGYGILSFI
jgi:presenilin-like A22 family membrane protease|tara:strand:- start:143 stop:1048 length:906 start_codon:yes stop_codon:yes gene_type:complete